VLFSAPEGSSMCTPSTMFYVAIAIGAVLLVVLGFVLWIVIQYHRVLWKHTRRTYYRFKPRQDVALVAPTAPVPTALGDTKPLIPTPLPGPVYAGL